MPRSVNGRIGILSQGHVDFESQFRSMAGDFFRDIARRAEEQIAPFNVQHYGVLVSFFHQRREGIGALYKRRFALLLLAGAMNAREHLSLYRLENLSDIYKNLQKCSREVV